METYNSRLSVSQTQGHAANTGRHHNIDKGWSRVNVQEMVIDIMQIKTQGLSVYTVLTTQSWLNTVKITEYF